MAGVYGLLVAAFVLAPGLLCAQATLWLNRGSQLFCPGGPAFASVIFTNRTSAPQTIPAGTILRLAFSIAVDVTGPVQPGIVLTQEVNGVTATFPAAYTVAANGALIFQAIALHAAPANHAAITVRLTSSPARALTLTGEGYSTVVAVGDDHACSPSPAFTVDDLAAACPSAAEVGAFNARTTLRFDADPTAGQLVCRAADGSADLTRLQERAYQALRLMQILPFETRLPWTSKSLYDWFTNAARGIRFRSDIDFSFCCDPNGFINIQTKNLGATQFNTSEWLGTLMVLFVHEARHNEGLPHTCGSWDQTLTELGAWGVQYYLNEWIALCTGTFFSPPAGVSSPGSYRAFYWSSAQSLFDQAICDTSRGVAVAPGKLVFDPQAVGTTSTSQTVAITAMKGAAVPIGSIVLGGANPGDFVLGGEPCTGASIPPTCTVLVSFQPKAAGTRTATLSIGSDVVSLTGSGGDPPCTFLLSRQNEIVSSNGGTGTIDVTATSGCPWDATVVDPWLSLASPAAGSGNGRISYSVATNFSHNPRQGVIRVAGLTFAVAQPGAPAPKVPQFTAQGVTNSASFVTGIPAGSLATIFGMNISTNITGVQSAQIFPYPQVLGGTRVLVNGIAAPLTAVGNTAGLEFVSLQIPWEVVGQNPVTVVLENLGAQSTPIQLNLPAFQPGIYTVDGTAAVVLHPCSSGPNLCVVTPAEPAHPGEPIVFYATGLGPVDHPVRTNEPAPIAEPLARTPVPPDVSIGGLKAKVDFSGLLPGSAGVYQINTRIPDTLDRGTFPGMVPISMSIGGMGSRVAFVMVR